MKTKGLDKMCPFQCQGQDVDIVNGFDWLRMGNEWSFVSQKNGLREK